jgi:hypothetical protein
MSHVTALCLATYTEKTKTLKSEVLAEVTQATVFWDMTTCSLVDAY